MDEKQVRALMENCGLPDSCNHLDFIETHISWVILTDNYAFKIKKPVKFAFLDFSTFEKRQHFCNRELKLNRRLAPGMYLQVLPLTQSMTGPGSDSDEVIDHAVQMERMDNKKEMGKLLEKDEVTGDDIDRLAKKITGFHQQTEVIKNVFDTAGFIDMYAEIKAENDFVRDTLGEEWADRINRSVEYSGRYLNESRSYFNERVTLGYKRDCHGDLNSHNIFLYDDPVIFDCIEYNEEFRHIDVLNEIAFLCVDLDFYGRKDLSARFNEKYIHHMNFDHGTDEQRLFNYYKSFRANIRAKVTILNEKGSDEGDRDKEALEDIKKYIEMMAGYLEGEVI